MNDLALAQDLSGIIREPQALRLPDGLTWEQWESLTVPVLAAAVASTWWLGDLIVYAEDHLAMRDANGEVVSRDAGRIKQVILQVMGASPQKAYTATHVSRSFPPSHRVPGCDWSHHREVIPLGDRDRQASLLYKASNLRWSKEQLRREVRKVKAEVEAKAIELGELEPPPPPPPKPLRATVKVTPPADMDAAAFQAALWSIEKHARMVLPSASVVVESTLPKPESEAA